MGTGPCLDSTRCFLLRHYCYNVEKEIDTASVSGGSRYYSLSIQLSYLVTTAHLSGDMLIVRFMRSVTQCLLSIDYVVSSLLALGDVKFNEL